MSLSLGTVLDTIMLYVILNPVKCHIRIRSPKMCCIDTYIEGDFRGRKTFTDIGLGDVSKDDFRRGYTNKPCKVEPPKGHSE